MFRTQKLLFVFDMQISRYLCAFSIEVKENVLSYFLSIVLGANMNFSIITERVHVQRETLA